MQRYSYCQEYSYNEALGLRGNEVSSRICKKVLNMMCPYSLPLFAKREAGEIQNELFAHALPRVVRLNAKKRDFVTYMKNEVVSRFVSKSVIRPSSIVGTLFVPLYAGSTSSLHRFLRKHMSSDESWCQVVFQINFILGLKQILLRNAPPVYASRNAEQPNLGGRWK